MANGYRVLAIAVEKYQETYDTALQIYSLFEDAEAAQLAKYAKELDSRSDEFVRAAELDWDETGNLGRHIHFLRYYLDSGDKEACRGDIRDIIFEDLPETLRLIVTRKPTASHFDTNLRNSVLSLIDGGHYDSAVRKAFVILTDRLRRAFGIVDSIDGEKLVNVVFGSGGKLPTALSDSEKRSYRDLLSGFYGVYRNRFAHNDVCPSITEAQAIVEMVNIFLGEIERVSAASLASHEKGPHEIIGPHN